VASGVNARTPAYNLRATARSRIDERINSLRTTDFDYVLPQELIAQEPLAQRDASRLMVLRRATETIEHRRFTDLPALLPPRAMLVLNQSRVIPARLHGRKSTGGRVEALLVERVGADAWTAMVRPGLRIGQHVVFGDGSLTGTVTALLEDGLRSLAFSVSGDELRDAIWRLGEMPTPPYVHRRLERADRYQTVYARVDGSVAAPTAGFHFTPELLAALQERGFGIEYVTLHVGPGTFQPVKADDVSEHRMHAERCTVEPSVADAINAARADGRAIVAVGTTSVRTLESAVDEPGQVRPLDGQTRLFVRPGFSFRAVDAMLTNFHLPRSTLLMLVSGFAGREFVLRAYVEAVRERYRFFSFGDAMLIL
jgi:S-adenosylmethionine:tRNA ribosyltransferase-isomerase